MGSEGSGMSGSEVNIKTGGEAGGCDGFGEL